MPQYAYKVKDRAGRTRHGSIEAESEHAAADMIRQAGGLPMDIRLVRGSKADMSTEPAGSAFVRHLVYPIWTGVDMRGLMFFYRKLAALLQSGVTYAEALRSISEHRRTPLGRIVRNACLRVQQGGRLSDEMARYPRVFPQMQVAMMRAGEQTGSPAVMAERIADHLEYEMAIRRRILLSVVYPSAFLLMFIPFSLGEMLVLAVAVKLALQFERVRYAWDWLKIRPPVLGKIAHQLAMSRFSKALALLNTSGLPIAQAVSVAADTCANTAIARRLKEAIPAINAGKTLTESMGSTGVILPEVLDMLAVGEQTGSYEIVLGKVAGYMDDETDAALYKLPIAMFVFLMLVGGALAAIRLASSISSAPNFGPL